MVCFLFRSNQLFFAFFAAANNLVSNIENAHVN